MKKTIKGTHEIDTDFGCLLYEINAFMHNELNSKFKFKLGKQYKILIQEINIKKKEKKNVK